MEDTPASCSYQADEAVLYSKPQNQLEVENDKSQVECILDKSNNELDAYSETKEEDVDGASSEERRPLILDEGDKHELNNTPDVQFSAAGQTESEIKTQTDDPVSPKPGTVRMHVEAIEGSNPNVKLVPKPKSRPVLNPINTFVPQASRPVQPKPIGACRNIDEPSNPNQRGRTANNEPAIPVQPTTNGRDEPSNNNRGDTTANNQHNFCWVFISELRSLSKGTITLLIVIIICIAVLVGALSAVFTSQFMENKLKCNSTVHQYSLSTASQEEESVPVGFSFYPLENSFNISILLTKHRNISIYRQNYDKSKLELYSCPEITQTSILCTDKSNCVPVQRYETDRYLVKEFTYTIDTCTKSTWDVIFKIK